MEDNEDTARLSGSYLERAGFVVQHAPDGQTALACLRDTIPVLVLLDINLPDLDGLEICRTIRQNNKLSDTPVIVVSGRNQRQDVMAALGAGANDFLVKPVDPSVLLHKVYTYYQPEISPAQHEQDEKWQEKRRYTRLVQLEQAESAEMQMDIEICDLSEDGLGLLSSALIEPGGTVVVRSYLLEEICGQYEFTLIIRYAAKIRGPHPYRLGGEFLGVGEQVRKRLRQYIFRAQAQRVRVRP